MSRSDAPRRRKKSAASRLRPFWILALVAIFLGTVAAYLGMTWSGFDPTHVAVTGNDAAVSTSEILAAARVDPGRNIWLQDTRAMAARVEAIPRIDRATVHRALPARVTIAVTERRPWAIVRAPRRAGGATVDADLRVLYATVPSGGPDTAIVPDRPVTLKAGTFLTDPQIVAMRDDLLALRAAHLDPVQVRYDRYESLIVTLRGGVLVLLGDDGTDLQKKIALIAPIRAQLAHGRPIAAIDLRAPSTPVVRYR